MALTLPSNRHEKCAAEHLINTIQYDRVQGHLCFVHSLIDYCTVDILSFKCVFLMGSTCTYCNLKLKSSTLISVIMITLNYCRM